MSGIKHTALQLLAAAAAAAVLIGCSAVQFSYNNMGSLIRYRVWQYVDLDAAQAEALQQRVARLQDWHRANELPAYIEFLHSADERVARGIQRPDVDWAIETLRARYRREAAHAAEEAAPLLVSLSADQIASVEKRLAKDDAKYVKEWLTGSPRRRERHAGDRLIERFEDWTGNLSAEQEARVRQFVHEHPRNAEIRLEERRQWQKAAVDLVKQYKKPQELASRLGPLFGDPDAGRSEEYMRETRRWEGDLAQLIVELDRTLSAEQRTRLLRRIDRYAEDFKALANRARSAGELPGARTVLSRFFDTQKKPDPENRIGRLIGTKCAG